ncbi:MAG: arylsulfatase, partial [Verrucomicrobiales bacterium]|nr:arylsulfatase [Verrucomicrobiales bacterium]
PLREALVSQSIGGQFAIRQGDWKLLLCPGSGGWSEPRPGRVDLSKYPAIQLYNLAKDPGEENNLQGSNPEKVKELKTLLAKYIEDGRSTPGAKQNNDTDIVMIKPVTPMKKKKN